MTPRGIPFAPMPTHQRGYSWTGSRRRPRDLDEVVRTEEDAQGNPRPVTLLDAMVEAMSVSGITADVAARAGITAAQLRDWRAKGARAVNDVLLGTRKLGQLTAEERQCAALDERLRKAENEARLFLAGTARREAQGGRQVRKTKVKHQRVEGALVEVERVEITETAAPDGAMLRWLLATRWPDEYGRARLELSGPDGGPIPVELRSASDKLLDDLSRMASHEQEVGALVAGALPANGNNHNGKEADA